MAVITDNLMFYNKNVLRSLDLWDILNNTSSSSDGLIIHPGGYAGCDLSGSYYSGLNASRYRKLTVSLQTSLSENFNYQNLVEIVLKGTYVDSSGNLLDTWYSIGCTLEESTVSGDTLSFERVVELENYDFLRCTVYVLNHTQSDVLLTQCEMLRSQDINSSQIGESIGFGVTLRSVVAYLDGCEIYYDGTDTPDKLWWMEDGDGNFSGINVNNERMISFTRKNEILLD